MNVNCVVNFSCVLILVSPGMYVYNTQVDFHWYFSNAHDDARAWLQGENRAHHAQQHRCSPRVDQRLVLLVVGLCERVGAAAGSGQDQDGQRRIPRATGSGS